MKVKNKFFKNFVAVSIMMLTLVFTYATVWADSPSGFGVIAILPDNQQDKSATYFNLKMVPGAEQTVQVEVTNTEKHEIIAFVDLNTAYTAVKGMISYSEKVEPDSSMDIIISDIAKVREPEKRIKPGEAQRFDIDIKMPEEKFDGLLLGGVVVTAEYAEETKTEGEQAPVSIDNKIVKITGIVLAETDVTLKPDMELKTADLDLNDYQPAVNAMITNKNRDLARGFSFHGEIRKKGKNKALFSVDYHDAEMAPQTTGQFPVPFGDKIIEAGDYYLHAEISMDGKKWKWDSPFEVDEDAANHINSMVVPGAENTSERKELSIWIWVSMAAVALLALAVIITISVKTVQKGHKKKKTNTIKKQ